MESRESREQRTRDTQDRIIEILEKRPLGLTTRHLNDMLSHDCQYVLSKMVTAGQLVVDTRDKSYTYRLHPSLTKEKC